MTVSKRRYKAKKMDPKVFQKRGILLSEKMQYKIKAIPTIAPIAQIIGDFD